MKKNNSTTKVSVYPYHIILIESDNEDNFHKPSLLKNHIQIFKYKDRVFINGEHITNDGVQKEMRLIPELSNYIDTVNKILKEKNRNRKKNMLYDLLVDILESTNRFPPLIEWKYERMNNHVSWILQAKSYYHAAQILERAYVDIINKKYKLKRKSLKVSRDFEEICHVGRVILYLYGRSLECIYKSRIFYKYELTAEYLTKNKDIKTKRALKMWMENNLSTHDINKLASLAGYRCRKQIDREIYDHITYLLDAGKYPSPKKSVLYKFINSDHAKSSPSDKPKKGTPIAIRKILYREYWFKDLHQIVHNALKKCYGTQFEMRFNESNRREEIREMTACGIANTRKTRERNELIKNIKEHVTEYK